MTGSLVVAVTAAGDSQPPLDPRLGHSAQKPGLLRVLILRSRFTDFFVKGMGILDALAVSCTDGTQSLTLPERLGPWWAQLGLVLLALTGRQLSFHFPWPA